MAQPLDLQEQEQLDDLKAFWKTYGNLITWALVAALAVFAALNGWKWWQREQSTKAAAMYDELDRAAQAGNAQRAGQIFADLKHRTDDKQPQCQRPRLHRTAPRAAGW